MTLDQLLAQLLGPVGALVAAFVVIVAFQREWIVPGATHRREIQRCEFFQRLALSGTSLAKSSAGLAQRGLDLAKERVQEESQM